MKLFVVLCVAILATNADDCIQRKTASGSICVCNSTYCDTVPPLAELKSGQYQLYTTSLERMGFASATGEFGDSSGTAAAAAAASFEVDVSDTHQTIYGFGGAFTDAAGINIATLSEGAQDLLLRSYFADDGISYTFQRVPIGTADFSVRGYTLCDEEDETLEKFALAEEDVKFKIPFIQKAMKLRGKDDLKLFAASWTAPIWMKDNDAYNGQSKILRKYYDAWARYYLKFLDSYKENDIDFWGISTQNEPNDGLQWSPIPNSAFEYDDMIVWITQYFGPYLRKSAYKDIKIMIHDDSRYQLPDVQKLLLSNADVVNYADGVSVHWYSDGTVPPEYLLVNSTKPLFMLATEACTDFHELNGENSVDLGNWQRGVAYVDDIVQDLNYDVVGWVEWNLALNGTGQPNWINYSADAPIIVDDTTDEFYKQPMFYVLGHFSKFVVPQSVRLGAHFTGDGLNGLAVLRPDNKVAVVISNSGNKPVDVAVKIGASSSTFSFAATSINTILYAL